jgi:hypothetical protein
MTTGQPIRIIVESRIAINILDLSIKSHQTPARLSLQLFHRVIAARMKRVAAQNPSRR